MAKDTLINVKNGDIEFGDNSSRNDPYFDVEWEGSVCKVKIPLFYASTVRFDSDGVFVCKVHIPYKPLNTRFSVQLYVDDGGGYSPCGGFCGLVVKYKYGFSESEGIRACQLMSIDTDCNYMLIFRRESDRVFVCSAKQTDFLIGVSDNQSAQILSICAPGKYYRYPITGVDITKYINTVAVQTDLASVAEKQFAGDGSSIQEMDFDSITGDIDIVFNGSKTEEDEELIPIDSLDVGGIDITDEDIATAGDGMEPTLLQSCFANGIWMGEMPWTGDYLWIGEP